MSKLSKSVSIHPYFKIAEGQMEAFKETISEFVQKTATESTCLFYDFTISGDRAFCREAYLDGDAALAHLANVNECIEKAVTLAELYRLEIHGPAEEIDKLREPLADLNPDFYTHIAGVASFDSSQ